MPKTSVPDETTERTQMKARRNNWKTVPDLERQPTVNPSSPSTNRCGKGRSNRRHQKQQLERRSEKISGIRKVWRTMRSTTTGSLTTTIAKFILPTLAGKVQVRRKFKSDLNGRVNRWWLLIRGDEESLLELAGNWNTVQMQTSWKLEECVKFIDSPVSHHRCKSAQ